LEHVVQHLGHLLHNERQRPGKNVHEVREVVRVRGEVELENVQRVVVEFEDCSLVVVNVR
jgi:hypothetical protein